MAKRLDAFAERVEQVDVARIASGEGFKNQDLVTADFVNTAGEIECDPNRVFELLDPLEGRFFADASPRDARTGSVAVAPPA